MKSWHALSPDFLTFSKVRLGLIDMDQELYNGANAQSIRECFEWREIFFEAPDTSMTIRRLRDCGMAGKPAANASAKKPSAPAPFIEGRSSASGSKPKKKSK